MITLENFSENNRTKVIGKSLYRICKEDDMWFIHEHQSSKEVFATSNAFFTKSLEKVICLFNKISSEGVCLRQHGIR